MAEKILLKSKARFSDKTLYQTRELGMLPIVVYGHNEKNESLMVGFNEFMKVYEQAGMSALIDLEIDGKEPVKVLVKEVQINPLTDRYIHVDLYKVKMTDKIHTDVEIVYENEAPAVKEQGGTLVKNYDKIEIECLPGDLMHEIRVDLSVLKNIHDTIQIKDLNLPKTITTKVDPEEVIATVMPIRIEEEKPAEEDKLPEAETAEGATAGEPEEEKKDNKKE